MNPPVVKNLGPARGRAARAAIVALIALALLAGAGTFRRESIKQALHAIDERYFHEALKDAFGRLIMREDWARAEPLRQPQDYRWMMSAASAVPIAHALGETTGDANSLAALRRSVAAGFKFFEVDLYLQGTVVRCFHGPEMPPPLTADSCTFDKLLAALPTDAWLVLDIKTDFAATGARIAEALRRSGRVDHAIFQLYAPADLATFDRWQATLPLAGPIVTIYSAHRSADTIAAQAARAGVRAFTLPVDRLVGFSQRPPSLAVFVHPIDDCPTLARALADGVRGVYMENNLGCAGMPSIVRSALAGS